MPKYPTKYSYERCQSLDIATCVEKKKAVNYTKMLKTLSAAPVESNNMRRMSCRSRIEYNENNKNKESTHLNCKAK